ncbi:MAG: hypothetical protein VX044_00705 [Planctomycetota bacterium]|nr:hypothetical protein [Planctomycetota bacterium]
MRAWATVLLAGVLGTACSRGFGGTPDVTVTPDIPVAVPPGTGILAIDMAGMWVIEDAVIIETNAPVPNPPFNGTMFELETTRIASIGGLSVAPGDLIAVIGSPLVSYVNLIESSTVYYGLVVDQRATGGLRIETALAGGAVDANTISVEAYNSTQSVTDQIPRYTRSRYVLVRTSGTTPLLHRPEELGFEDLFRRAFGGF